MQRCAIISYFVPGLDTGQGGKKDNFLLRAAVEKEKKKCENQQHCNPITNIRWHRDPNFVSTQIFQDLAGFFGFCVCVSWHRAGLLLFVCAPALMDDFIISVGKVTRVKLFCLFVCVCAR